MILEFRGGNICPQGSGLLAVEVEGRRFLRKAVSKIPGLTLHQDGDDFQSWTFPVKKLNAVVAVVQPYRVRKLTEKQKADCTSRLVRRQSA